MDNLFGSFKLETQGLFLVLPENANGNDRIFRSFPHHLGEDFGLGQQVFPSIKGNHDVSFEKVRLFGHRMIIVLPDMFDQ